MAALVARAGAALDPAELARFCETRLPYFAIPRYVDVVADLPRTENGKVQKYKLRERGVTRERPGTGRRAAATRALTMTEYWNPELETLPWSEVERWQAEQVTAMLPALRRRSRLYARLHAGVRRRSRRALGGRPRRAAVHAQGRPARRAGRGERRRSPSATTRPRRGRHRPGDLVVGHDRPAALLRADRARRRGLRRRRRQRLVHRRHPQDDIVAHLVGLPMVAGGLPYADGFRRIGATLCWLGGFPTERILREMRHLRVTALLATTSFALHLAEQWDAVGRETGIASRLRKVLGGGEPGLGQPELRRRIAGGLALTHLRETMGLGDVIPSMWGECEARTACTSTPSAT